VSGNRQLERINLSCTSPVKMSLLLLDYLFDRDTQAVCNVSGSGKLGKRRLDPLLMYGIQCKASLYLAASCCLLRYCLNAVKLRFHLQDVPFKQWQRFFRETFIGAGLS